MPVERTKLYVSLLYVLATVLIVGASLVSTWHYKRLAGLVGTGTSACRETAFVLSAGQPRDEFACAHPEHRIVVPPEEAYARTRTGVYLCRCEKMATVELTERLEEHMATQREEFRLLRTTVEDLKRKADLRGAP